jgi:hypothetical protein
MRINLLLGLATACLFSSMTLPVNAEDNTKQSDNNTRLYVEAYGFFPLETHSKTTLNNNITSETLDLNDVLDMLTGVFSGKVAVEKGRFGLQAGLDHLSFRTSEMVSSWQSSNPIQNESHPRLPQRRINSEGSIKSVTDTEQTLFDLALRYRGGAIQKPRMTPGAVSFVGFAGMRLIDASLDMDVSFKDDVTFEGILSSRKLQRHIEAEAGETWHNTWMQPLVGMNTTVALGEDWQAFLAMDAGGFGLNGKQDLSGTVEAGLAYALGNSAQISLAYRYFGIEYSAHNGRNGYSSTQNGVSMGFRWLFD